MQMGGIACSVSVCMQAVEACIDSCDVDIRRELLGSILVTGGGSLMPGGREGFHNSSFPE